MPRSSTGCSRFRRVFAIDLPAIRGPLALIIILSMNSAMQEFSTMFVMTQGGPANATMSPAFYLFTQAFDYGEHGYATAIGTVLMLMTLVFSIVYSADTLSEGSRCRNLGPGAATGRLRPY